MTRPRKKLIESRSPGIAISSAGGLKGTVKWGRGKRGCQRYQGALTGTRRGVLTEPCAKSNNLGGRNIKDWGLKAGQKKFV